MKPKKRKAKKYINPEIMELNSCSFIFTLLKRKVSAKKRKGISKRKSANFDTCGKNPFFKKKAKKKRSPPVMKKSIRDAC
ncbi:hypothetical protein HON22_04795 [Candidatus Peregrinibacteria bacterium]|jgi:hypothetical protein|nr:hypothetical protein [Candidatus Peregrinibacteria bacterium]